MQALEQVAVKERRALVLVAAERRSELEHDQVVESHAGIGGLEVLQAPDEEPRAEQQQEAERHLRRDESFAEKQRAAGAGYRSDRVLERLPWIRPARTKGGQQSEDDAGHEREDQREP